MMSELIPTWYDAELNYRAEQIKSDFSATRPIGPRSGRRRGRSRDRGSWKAWRSTKLAG